jgi:hypothetical protein
MPAISVYLDKEAYRIIMNYPRGKVSKMISSAIKLRKHRLMEVDDELKEGDLRQLDDGTWVKWTLNIPPWEAVE